MVEVPTIVTEPAAGFELTVVDVDALRVAICAVGEFDLAARDALDAVLRHAEDAGRRIVRLDVSLVTFLDCSCVGVLVASHHRLLDLRGLLVLTGVGARVARILKLTGLDGTLFTVVPGQDPFESVLLARAARHHGIPNQRPAMAAYRRKAVSRSLEVAPTAGTRTDPERAGRRC